MSTKYTEVISSAISSFNSIWTSLKNKNVTIDVSGVNTVLNDSMTIPVAQYSGFITNQLSRLKVKNAETDQYDAYLVTVGSDEAYVANTTLSDNAFNLAVSFTDNTYSATATIGTAGYYEANARITKDFTATPVTLEGTSFASAITQNANYTVTDEAGYYVISPIDVVLGKVSVKKGTAKLKIDANDLSCSLSATGVTSIKGSSSTITAGTGNNVIVRELIGTETAPTTGYVSVTLETAVAPTGTVTAALSSDNVTLSAGYVTAMEYEDAQGNAKSSYSQTKTFTFDPEATDNETFTKTIYIKEASVSGITGSGNASANFATDLGALAETEFTKQGSTLNKSNYYEVTASATLNIDTENATINPGYISADTELAIDTTSTAISDAKYYIKKGSVKTVADHQIDVALSEGTMATVTDTDGTVTGYKIPVNLATSSTGAKSLPIDNGFITSISVPYELTGGSHDVELTRGTVSVSPAGLTTSVTSGYNTSIFSTTSGDNAITITPVLDLDTNDCVVSSGYIKDRSDLTINSVTAVPTTIYVNNAVGTLTTNLSAVYVDANKNDGIEDPDANGDSITDSKISIFSANVPTNTDGSARDYYKVTATSKYDLTTGGYIGSDVEDTVGQTLYVPRAKLKYVQDSTVGTFLEVEAGGYIPSGALTQLEGITGTIDYAALEISAEAKAGTGSSILSTTGTADDYALTIAKTSNSNAGYIAGAEGQGSVALESTYYIKKAEATVTNTIADNNVGLSTFALSGNKYAAKISVTSESTLAIDKEGYVKASDLKGVSTGINGETANGTLSAKTYSISTSKEKVVELAKATIITDTVGVDSNGIKNNIVTLRENVNTTVETVTSATGYAVVVELDKSKIGVKADTAGYIDASAGVQEVDVALPEAFTVNIQAGTALANVANTTTASVNVPGAWDATSNTYKFATQTPEISVSGTLTEGYYADDLLAVSGKATITATATDIAGASAKMSASGSAGIADVSGATLYLDAEKDSNKAYIEIAPVATASVTASNVSVGYLNSTAQITSVNTNNSYTLTPTAKYIEKYTGLVEGTRSDLADYKDAEGSEIDHIHSNSVYKVTVGSKSFIDTGRTDEAQLVRTEAILTEEKYVNKDIEITLHADAMGSNVYAEIAALEARLLGVLSGVQAE